MRLLIIAFAFVLIAPAAPHQQYLVSWAMETRVYPGNREGHDFLAVLDITDGPQFGRVVAMLPVPTLAQMAHHSNYDIPPNHMLFVNDFMAGRSYIFDLRDPMHPRVAASFEAAGPYTHPHSFAYLSNGNTLATYQQKGDDDSTAGALVELDAKGRMLRTSDASAPAVDTFIRPYSLLVLEGINRVITTSADMMPSTRSSHVIQVWRLSDLKLLSTVALPKPERYHGVAGEDADEARLLLDGTTVLVQTANCGLYRVRGLDGTNPSAEFVYDFGYRACPGVPLVEGHYWVEASMSGHSITSLDVRDPSHPVEVGHIMFDPGALPHWLAAERGTNRIVITGYGSIKNTIHFARIDPKTGALTLERAHIDFDRKWPDGWNGPAMPHATLFYY